MHSMDPHVCHCHMAIRYYDDGSPPIACTLHAHQTDMLRRTVSESARENSLTSFFFFFWQLFLISLFILFIFTTLAWADLHVASDLLCEVTAANL